MTTSSLLQCAGCIFGSLKESTFSRVPFVSWRNCHCNYRSTSTTNTLLLPLDSRVAALGEATAMATFFSLSHFQFFIAYEAPPS